jgi:glycosyltransferase involved in cell wall biosynthesis
MLKICLDVRMIGPTKSGLGRCSMNLVNGLAAFDDENEYTLLKNPAFAGRLVDRPNFKEVSVPGDASSVWSALTLSRLVNRLAPDVYHALLHFLPFGLDVERTVITLHDLMWIEAPSLTFPNPLKAQYNKQLKGRLIKHAAVRADRVISISEATRGRAVDLLGIPPSKCRTIHHGVETLFLDPAAHEARVRRPTPEVLQIFKQTGEDFVVYLGNSRAYKNVDGIIRAFHLVHRKHPGLKLLLVGRGDLYPVLKRLAARLGLSERVIFRSSVTDSQLTDVEVITILKRARMLASPSFLEGFGLPLLEAMAVGCPVLTSNVSAPAEIVGDSGLLVDPHDVEAIAEGMERILNDDSLRRELIERGLRRAARFTIDRNARATHALYTEGFGLDVHRGEVS